MTITWLHLFGLALVALSLAVSPILAEHSTDFGRRLTKRIEKKAPSLFFPLRILMLGSEPFIWLVAHVLWLVWPVAIMTAFGFVIYAFVTGEAAAALVLAAVYLAVGWGGLNTGVAKGIQLAKKCNYA